MAILKDLIVHGSSRFLNKIYASEIQTPLIEAEAGVFKKLKADDATVVGLLDVKGQMHTNSWSNSNIATIDGSFYITPTIGSASGTVTITASTLTFSGTNYAISSLYLGDGSSITWPQYSKVLVTGQILSNGEWIPLGTLLGQLSSAATAASISINNIKDNKNQTSNVLATLVSNGTTSSSYRNLKVSLYQRASSSTAFYPLGIYMTATGINGRTFLDIYGGVEALSNNNNYGGLAEPNVRIGNLQGLPNVGGQTPSGWGIYTDNGYFKGIIAADKGFIGSGSKYWVIGNYEDGSSSDNDRSYIYNGTNSTTSTIEGVYLGTDGIRNYKDNTHYVTIKNGVISALGVDLSGNITASSGTIGGWHIGTDTNKSLYYGNQIPGATTTNLVLSPTSVTNSNAIGGSATGLKWFLSAGKVFGITTAGALYATSGKIGSWEIGSNYLLTGTWGTGESALISTGSSSSKKIGGSDSINNWVFTAGANFGVTKSGALYASSANISGKVVATSGSIGGIEIENGVLKVSSINIGNLGGASNYAQKTDVTQAIDNIEIGGRNLIWNSNFQLPINGNWNNWGLASTTREIVTINNENWMHIVTTADAFQGYQQSQINRNGFGQIQAGDKIIFSYDAYSKIEGQKGCIGIHWRDSNDTNISQSWTSFDLTTTKKRYITPVFTVPTNAVGFNIMIGQSIAAAQEIWITNIKGEKGNKATDWTPAPEDIDNNIATVQTNADAVNLSPYFSYSPYVVNDYWKSWWSNQPAITFTEIGDGWVRIQCTNTGTSTIRKDFYPIYNLEIKEGTDYTWLIEFRNNQSQIDGTASGSDFYLVQTNNCQFWGGTIKENIEGMGTGSTTRFIDNIPIVGTEVDGITITKDFVYKKRFIKTSESTGSSRWTDGSADNLVGLACFTARCAKNTTIDCEVRISLYEGRYLGEYKPYVDSAASSKIDDAKQSAEEAKKVATNYLSMDSTGIMVADMNDGEQKPSEATGRNVFIDNDSVDIRNGTTTLASFTGDNTKFYDPIYNKELATFGASGAMIGVEGEQRFVIEKDSVRAINSSGGTLFSIVSTDKTFITEAEAAPSGECSDYLIGDVTRTLDAGDSTTDNSFYIDRIYIIVSLTNSSKVLTNVKINSIAATADRIKYNTNTEFGFAYSSSHSIDVPFSPAFSCNYGTSKSSNYVMTATFVNDYGDSYNLTFSFKITYNGARKLTFSQPTKECIRTSGNNETIAKFDALNPNKYVFSQVISSTANTRAPAMTFGTRTGEDGMLSSAFGQGLYAEKDGEFVIGRYNNQELQTDSKYSFIIGNGEDNEHRSNALTIDWSGNICLGIDVVSSEADAELLIAIQNAGWESSVIE